MEFGEKLSAARKAKGFSQEELAAKIEVSRQAVSKWENGTAQPETANIIKLCEVLEVSPNELFGYEPQRESPPEDKKIIISSKSLAIFGITILLIILVFYGCKNGVKTEKTIRFPITSYSHSLVLEECTEDFLAVEIIFVSTSTSGIIFGVLEGTAIFLTQPATGRIFAVLMHGKSRFADDIADNGHFRVLLVSRI